MRVPSFDSAVANYSAFLKSEGRELSRQRVEAHVESWHDWSPLHTVDDVRQWFTECRDGCTMWVEHIPLEHCKGWSLNSESGYIEHESGDFFYVQGLRTSVTHMREVASGWDQPMLTQVGYDGGILGLIRKRFDGVPLYLVEAKAEPGNYKLIQLSPTLQATYANINQAHKGRRPLFVEYFLGETACPVEVLYDQFLSEDGGRLMNKRNRGMLVEVPADHAIELPNENFRWVSLWQIKACLKENAWVNPHIRGIIAHL